MTYDDINRPARANPSGSAYNFNVGQCFRALNRSIEEMAALGRIRCTKIQREAEGYLELDMPKQALETLARLGAPSNFDAEALYLWGESLRALQRPLEALMPLERAVRLAPEDIRVRIALAWCYKRAGRLDLAIEAIEQALLIAPDESLLHYNLACYFSLTGRKRLAIKHLSQAFGTDPVYRELVEAETDFDPIRSDAEFRTLCGDSEEANQGRRAEGGGRKTEG